jgi:hypothetical protein
MARYIIDGTVLDTEKAEQTWEERTYFNGRNRVGVLSRDEFYHQALYRSSKGRYWVECWSQWQGSVPSARIISEPAAARWLIINEYELPPDLQKYADEVWE